MTSKNRKKVNENIDTSQLYPLKEALEIIKKHSYVKFDASVDIDVHLGVDPRKADQMLRGTITLPHGIGKKQRVLALVMPEDEDKAKEAEYSGLNEYLEKIEKGWTDVDVIVTTPSVMPRLAKLGRILGPKGLMPNPKVGTVTTEIDKTIKEIKLGRIDFRVDKYGIIHSSIGRVSFEASSLEANALEFFETLQKMKPSTSKGTYFKSLYLSSTMGPGIQIDKSTLSFL